MLSCGSQGLVGSMSCLVTRVKVYGVERNCLSRLFWAGLRCLRPNGTGAAFKTLLNVTKSLSQ